MARELYTISAAIIHSLLARLEQHEYGARDVMTNPLPALTDQQLASMIRQEVSAQTPLESRPRREWLLNVEEQQQKFYLLSESLAKKSQGTGPNPEHPRMSNADY